MILKAITVALVILLVIIRADESNLLDKDDFNVISKAKETISGYRKTDLLNTKSREKVEEAIIQLEEAFPRTPSAELALSIAKYWQFCSRYF
jgi:hypothetical protein